jgi:hypothetical protein
VMHHDRGKLVELTPSCEYLCPDCGSECRWIKDRGLKTIFDSIRLERSLTYQSMPVS